MSQPPHPPPDQLVALLQQPGIFSALTQLLTHAMAPSSGSELAPLVPAQATPAPPTEPPPLPTLHPSSTSATSSYVPPSSQATTSHSVSGLADSTAPLRPYSSTLVAAPGAPPHGTPYPTTSRSTPGNIMAPGPSTQPNFGPPASTFAGHPVATHPSNPISFASSAAAFLPHQPNFNIPSSSAVVMTPSSPAMPSFTYAQQHASRQRSSAIIRHGGGPGASRRHVSRRSAQPVIDSGPTVQVTALFYPTTPGLVHNGEVFCGTTVMHQARRTAFRERAAQLGLVVSLQVNRHTDNLLSVQDRVRQALKGGPAQLRFPGLDDLLATATTTNDRLPFLVLSSCRRGYTRADGNIYHRPHPAPLSDQDMQMVNFLEHDTLARPQRLYWEGGTFLMYFMSKVRVEGRLPFFGDNVWHHCLMDRLARLFTTDQHLESTAENRARAGLTQEWHEPGGYLTSDSEDDDDDDDMVPVESSSSHASSSASSSSSSSSMPSFSTSSLASTSSAVVSDLSTSASLPSSMTSSTLQSTAPVMSSSNSATTLLSPTFPAPLATSFAAQTFAPSMPSQSSVSPVYLSPVLLPHVEPVALTPTVTLSRSTTTQGLDNGTIPLLNDTNSTDPIHNETVEFLAAMRNFPSYEPFSRRVSSNSHRLHYLGNIPTTRASWGWKAFENAERGHPPSPLRIQGEDFSTDVVPRLLSHVETAVRTNNASRIIQSHFTITTVSPEGRRIAQGEGLIREAITQLHDTLAAKCKPFMHITPAGYHVVSSSEGASVLSRETQEHLKLFGFVHAMHLIWIHSAAPFTSPPYLQLLLHGGDLGAITSNLLTRWDPTTLEVLNSWITLGPLGSPMDEPHKSTLEYLFSGLQVAQVPHPRTPQQHNQIWHMMLKVLLVGSLQPSPHRDLFEAGFSLQTSNGWSVVKAAHCYRSSTMDFVNDYCGHHIKSPDDILPRIHFTFTPPDAQATITSALQEASGDPWMTFPGVLEDFLRDCGAVSIELLQSFIQDGRITYSGDLAELDDPGFRSRLLCRAASGSLALPTHIQVVFMDDDGSVATKQGEVFFRSCLSQIKLPSQAIIRFFRRDHLLEPEGVGLDSSVRALHFWLLRSLLNAPGMYGLS